MKFRTFPALAALVLASFLYFSCQKSDSPGTKDPNVQVIATVSGRILDENRLPVNGVTVKAGSRSVNTDINGAFTISNVSLEKNAGMITVEKAGYFKGIKTIVVAENKENRIVMQLIKKTVAGSFNASGGGSITVPSGGTLVFQAGSIMKADSKSVYTGTVAVSAFFINPEDPDFLNIMPGDLRGFNTSNQEIGLKSFGMMTVDLVGDAGEKLQLITGKTATIEFPIAASLQSQAPATIPLWSLDETTGLWKEESVATRHGNNYTGNVGHFSTWNCDIPLTFLPYTITVLDQQQRPVVDAWPKLTAIGPDSALFAYGFTAADSAGLAKGYLPANRNVLLKIYERCGKLLYQKELGPFTVPVDLGTITVAPAATPILVTGTAVNCNAAPLTSGYVILKLNRTNYRSELVNGNFSFSLMRCTGPDTKATITAYDPENIQLGAPDTVTINGTNVNTGQLKACYNTFTQYIHYDINGRNYTYAGISDTMYAHFYDANQQTLIAGSRSLGGMAGFISISLQGAPVAGPIPMWSFEVRDNNVNYRKTGSMTVNITQYGALGNYITGNFTGNIKDTITSTVLPINCTFRIKRTN